MATAWSVLVVSAGLEVIWPGVLKKAQGFRHKKRLVIGLTLPVLSVGSLAWTMQWLPLGTAYAAWAGIATMGNVVVGMVAFKERLTLRRFILLALLIGGIVGLQLFE